MLENKVGVIFFYFFISFKLSMHEIISYFDTKNLILFELWVAGETSTCVFTIGGKNGIENEKEKKRKIKMISKFS